MALTKISGSVIKDSVSLSGNVSVGGTLTYQDVTNVDALGIGTFRSGINISGGQLDVGNNIKIGNAGIITATELDISGNIDVDGQTNLDHTSIVGIVTISAGTNNEGLRITGQHNNCVIFTSPSINGSAGYRLNHHPSTNFLRVDTTDQNGTFTGTVAKFSSAGLDMADNIKLRLGTNQDLTLYHYGNDAYIDNADGAIIFRQGTSEKLRIDAGGGLQLGTSTATASKLTVYGANDAAAIFQGSGTGTGAGNGLLVGNNGGTTGLLWNYENGNTLFATNNIERLRITSTGKITHTYDGTAYDAQYGQFEITKDGTSNADPDWSYLSLHRAGQIAWQQGIDSNHFVIATTGGGAKNTLDAEKLRITTGGNVGINQTNPNKAKLHVVADSGSTDKIVAKFRNPQGSADVKAKIGFVAGYSDTANDTEGQAYIGAQREGNGNNAALFFETSDGSTLTERMRIENSGISGTIKNNYALVAFVSDRDDGARSTGSTSYQDDTGLVLSNAITYRHGDIIFVEALCPTGIALVSTDTANYVGVNVRLRLRPTSGSDRYSNDTKGWYRDDGRATKETMPMTVTHYHLQGSDTSSFNDNVQISFQVQYKRESGNAGSYGATGLSIWSGERTLKVWQYRKAL